MKELKDFRGRKIEIGDPIYYRYGFSGANSTNHIGIVKKVTGMGVTIFGENYEENIWANFPETLYNRLLLISPLEITMEEKKKIKAIMESYNLENTYLKTLCETFEEKN